MREILFRGKRKDNDEWVEGNLFIDSLRGAAIDYFKYHEHEDGCEREFVQYAVIPETVGQYTGLKDKNGTKIFEGDICHFYGGEYYSGLWEIDHTCEITFCHECLGYLENAEYVEVIGNIFDNPELIEGDKI